MHALLTQDGQVSVATVLPKTGHNFSNLGRIAGTFPTTSFQYDTVHTLPMVQTQPPELRSSVFSLSVAVRRLFIMCTLDCELRELRKSIDVPSCFDG